MQTFSMVNKTNGLKPDVKHEQNKTNALTHYVKHKQRETEGLKPDVKQELNETKALKPHVKQTQVATQDFHFIRVVCLYDKNCGSTCICFTC